MKKVTGKVYRCKNGSINHNTVKKGFFGTIGWRYHPTKGYRRDKGFTTEKPKVSALENMLVSA